MHLPSSSSKIEYRFIRLSYISLILSIFLGFFSFVGVSSVAAISPSPVLTLSGSNPDVILQGSGVVTGSLSEALVSNAFLTGGVAQGWHADDNSWAYVLPFGFTYYGVTYASGQTIRVSSNGYICLDSTQGCNSTNDTIDNISNGPFIAPLWKDLYTPDNSGGGVAGNDIYITTDSNSVTFRWQATDCCGTSNLVNFSATLFKNGQIRFDYGDQPIPYGYGDNTTVGISKGDGVIYTASAYNHGLNFNWASSSFWQQASAYVDPGATWIDVTDGSGFIAQASSGTVDITTVGTYTLEYTYVNTLGQTGSITRTVNVIAAADTTPPVVTLVGSGSITLPQGSVFSDSGATWSDNVDGTGSIATASSGAVNTSIPGIYTLEYTKVDAASNTGNTVTRTVTVLDTEAPVVTLVGSGSIVIANGGVYTELGATWSDNVDGTGSIAMASSGTVNTTIAGTYTLTYSKVDIAGNTGSIIRTVSVSAPIVSSGGGGGGGGGSSSSYIAPTPTASTTSTGSQIPLTPVVTTSSGSTVIAQDKFQVSTKILKESKILTTQTTLKDGTRVMIYRILPRGKTIKVGVTRVVKGKIRYQVKSTGNYLFKQ